MAIDRRSLVGALLASGAIGWSVGARAGGDEPLPDAVCRGLQLADATQGTSENLTGERADVDMMEKLGLLEGHLLIGKQLLQANMSSDAQPHFGHPAEEIY